MIAAFSIKYYKKILAILCICIFIGGAAGFAGASAGYFAANSSFLVNGVNSPVLRTLAVAPLASGAGHVAGGTTAGLLEGQSLGNAFGGSFEGIEKSIGWGTAIGVATTVGMSYANGVNPLSGKIIQSSKLPTSSWKYGDHKSQLKWETQMIQRGWTKQQITEAILNGDSYSAINNINPSNGATRYVHPLTGRSVVIDNITGNILHIGGDGFKY